MKQPGKLRLPPRVHPLWAVAFFALLLFGGGFLVVERLGRPPKSFPAAQPMAAANSSYLTIIQNSLREGVHLTGRAYQENGEKGSIYVCAEIKGQPTETGQAREPAPNAPTQWAVWHVKNPSMYIIQSVEPIARTVSTLHGDDAPPDTALKLQKSAQAQSERN